MAAAAAAREWEAEGVMGGLGGVGGGGAETELLQPPMLGKRRSSRLSFSNLLSSETLGSMGVGSLFS